MWKDIIEENFRSLRGWEIQEFIIKLLCSCSVVSDSATPWTVAHQVSLSMGFSRQEYWSTFESVLMRWMKLEPIIQSEVSQKETPIQYTSAYIYGIWKDGNNNPVYETAKETQMYRIVFWTLWERERVGRFGRMALKHV